jgi:hypothetical protein
MNKTIPNPFCDAIRFRIGNSIHVIGFAMETGVLLFAYLMPLVHILVLFLVNLLGFSVELFSWSSLGILPLEILVAMFGLGFRITVTAQHFRVAEFFLGIPYSGFKAKLEAVSLSDPMISGKVADVHVYTYDDLWGDMGIEHWIEIQHQGKEYQLAPNRNYQRYYEAIAQAVAEQRAHQNS